MPHSNIEIREDFLFLKSTHNNYHPIFLDNASTTQKPRSVLQAMQRAYVEAYSNVHRSVCHQGYNMTSMYEDIREKVRGFIKSSLAEEIIFTKGTTESINLVANSISQYFQEGDEIILSYMEHHSNILPWQVLAHNKNLQLKFIGVDEKGYLMDIEPYLSSKTKLVALTHCSNVLGTINEVQDIIACVKQFSSDILVLIDGAQSVAHLAIDVQEMGCDFFTFSGHKIYGPNGIGILYAKQETHKFMRPYQTGGGMIKDVNINYFVEAKMPWKLEAGTPNIVGVIGLGAAIDYIEKITPLYIKKHNDKLVQAAQIFLDHTFKNIQFLSKVQEQGPILSFRINDFNSHDAAYLLSNYNICVRADNMCAQPLLQYLNSSVPIRISFGIYNTIEEIEIFIQKLNVLFSKITNL